MINFYLLRKDENIELFKLLKYEYIKESFLYLINSMVELLSLNNKLNIDKQKFGYNILFTIDKILLDNLCTMVINNNFDLLYLINNKLLCSNLIIKTCYLHDLYTDLTPNNYTDYDYFEIEYKIKKLLEKYINYIYINNSDKYNEVFIKIINMLYEELSWFSSTNFRIEILYETIPTIIVPKI